MKQKILLLDNYDSFTYNLKHYIDALSGYECSVFRNDEINPEQAADFDSIVLSPGPGLPEESGILIDLIKLYFMKKKMLGVCLGHQAMATATGGKLLQLNKVMHGLKRKCTITYESRLYEGMQSPFDAGRYHSWVVDKVTLPAEWIATAVDDDGSIMSMEHKTYPLYGVQFHPESIMTPEGRTLINNWLKL